MDYTLSDIAAVSDRNDGMFGGSGGGGMWIFALLILLLLGGGNGFFGGGNAASSSDIQRAVDLNSIQEGQNSINSNIQRVGYEIMGTVKDSAYNNLSEIRDVQAGISAGFAGMQNCCCSLDKSIMENRYLAERNTAAITAAVHAEGEATRSMIMQDKNDALQARVTTLELQNAMCGVVRYPMSSCYSSGGNPFCGSSCCNGSY